MGILRFLLAITVVISHSNSIFGFRLVGAVVAVQTFYLISGFYISLILNEKYQSYSLFITNRFLRLYPIYWIILLLTLFFSLASFYLQNNPMMLDSWFKYSKNMDLVSIAYLIITNIIIFGQDFAYFLGVNVFNGQLFLTSKYYAFDPQLPSFILLPQAWTIAIEFLFYLIAPFLVKKNYKLIVAFVLFSFATRILMYKIGFSSDPWLYRFFPFEAGFFFLGILAYKVYCRVRKLNIPKVVLHTVFILAVLLTLFFQYIPEVVKCVNLTQYFYYLIIFIILPFLFIFFKTNKLDRYIG